MMTVDVLTDVLRRCRVEGTLLGELPLGRDAGLLYGGAGVAGFHFITQGMCFCRVQGRRPFRLLQGDLLFLPTGLRHELLPSESAPARPAPMAPVPREARGAVARFLCGGYRTAESRHHPLLSMLPPVIHMPASELDRCEALRAVLRLLVLEATRPEPGSDALIEQLIHTLLIYFVRHFVARSEVDAGGWLKALSDAQLARALSEIHARPGDAHTVATLARSAGMSRAAFARRFQALAGQPPLAYVSAWRMRVAASLLRDTPLGLAQVAQKVGYESEFAFSRAFKRHTGRAPSHFRLQERTMEQVSPAREDGARSAG